MAKTNRLRAHGSIEVELGAQNSQVNLSTGRTSCQHDPDEPAHYRNAYPLPSVYGMTSPQGAHYDDTNHRPSEVRVFPRFHIPPLHRNRGPLRVDCLSFNVGIVPRDIRAGYPNRGGC